MDSALNSSSNTFAESSASPHIEISSAGSRFVRACLRQPVDRTPVWFLRQAGRYMPEYMEVRKRHSLLDICRTPEVAAEVTITAAERLGVDAAIIFADLLLPFTPMGLDFEFVTGEGPVVHTPVRTLEQVQALRTVRTDELMFVARAIEKVATHFAGPRADGDTLGIIGFCGAPWTLAGYMIEGGKQSGGDRNYIETKKLMYSNAAAWSLLMEKIVMVLVAYARQQVEAGADVIGLDWRVPLEVGWKAVGAGCAVQGNLDPISLFAPEEVLKERVRAVLDAAAGRPGHIFNVGHGIVPGTPV